MRTQDLDDMLCQYPELYETILDGMKDYPDRGDITKTFILGGCAAIMAEYCDYDDDEHDYTLEMCQNILGHLELIIKKEKNAGNPS